MYEGNPREIDFGSSWRGFELSGVEKKLRYLLRTLEVYSQPITRLVSVSDLGLHCHGINFENGEK